MKHSYVGHLQKRESCILSFIIILSILFETHVVMRVKHFCFSRTASQFICLTKGLSLLILPFDKRGESLNLQEFPNIATVLEVRATKQNLAFLQHLFFIFLSYRVHFNKGEYSEIFLIITVMYLITIHSILPNCVCFYC